MKKNLLNSLAIVLAAIVLSAPALAGSGRLSDPLPTTQGLASVMPDFESQWAYVDAFIAAHVQFPNETVRLAIKSETKSGYATWVCGGGQVGWPVSLNSPPGSTLVFDSADNADTCAQMILAIISRP